MKKNQSQNVFLTIKKIDKLVIHPSFHFFIHLPGQVPKAPCFDYENVLSKNSVNKFLTTKKMADAKGHEEMITDQKLDSDDNQEEENDIKEKVESSVDKEINDLQELDTDENEDKSSDEIKQVQVKNSLFY